MPSTVLKRFHPGAMFQSKLTVTTGALFTVLLAVAPAVNAKPFLYVTSFSHGGKVEDCLAGAKKQSRKRELIRSTTTPFQQSTESARCPDTAPMSIYPWKLSAIKKWVSPFLVWQASTMT